MSSDTVIKVENISKCYQIFDSPQDRLKQIIMPGDKKYYKEFWALRDVSFEVRKGESVGIIGRNGSGKSTLLQIISGTLTPTSGNVEVSGRVAALLELGSGFNPEYTGRENVYLNGSILGISRKEMENIYDEIVSFADIGDFIDQPVKTYSSGMMVRLAFAVQACIEPEILIVDEALAVGDMLFQKRCFARMKALAEKGTTLLFVTHDIEMVRTFTSRAILLNSGEVVKEGPSADVVLEYRRRMHKEESEYFQRLLAKSNSEGGQELNDKVEEEDTTQSSLVSDAEVQEVDDTSDNEFGGKDGFVQEVSVHDSSGEISNMFYPGEHVVIRVKCKTLKTMNNLNIGLRIRNKTGMKIYSWGSLNQDIAIWSGRSGGKAFWSEEVPKGTTLQAEFKFQCNLGVDLYEIQAYIAQELDQYYHDERMLHWVDEAAFFHVNMKRQEYFFGGVSDLQMKTEIVSLNNKEKKGFVL
ncbi:ABC transporter ATP-binding protein [Paenibacillus mucilaginosus]|uniref:Putative polysaccharide export transport system ATP-binding protein n=1 Tax=Paenibacillus mucilaginosus (strain KNP414) TaxID=1036673 RepID=F8FQH2_PAEMK|nr:ABC transporter ATP-binding protein [Paenibacillus mucilaginosus]AEI39233.1 putative polysaccharide export transport system ATP-binding protein [Paenibacillus mucilaginosus KNP414]MCG7217125.1 ABC transporter ATP-binding protein [Paenibacillus mucilaginosus]WDM28241.1 ABC transporter ATP-binding protein [Paenibacillus mucilaginosus]